MSRWWLIAGPSLVVIVVGIGVLIAQNLHLRPSGEPVEVDFDALHDARYVRVRGAAHYATTMRQRVPGGFIRQPFTWYVYAFLPEDDPRQRIAPLLVRTQRRPEDLVDIEVMTIEGILGPIDRRVVPQEAIDQMADVAGYTLTPDAQLLEATRIVAEDGVWEEPP